MNTLTAKPALHNRFDVFKTDVKTGKTEQVAFAENIILDQFWQYLINKPSSAYFTNIRIGTGTGTLSSSRTALFTQLATISASGGTYEWNLQEGYASYRRSITITETQYVGKTITEVGIASANYLGTHALLQDMNGNTVSILKTNTDIITIYGTIYLVVDPAGFDSGRYRIAPLKNYHGSSSNSMLKALLGGGDSRYMSFNFCRNRAQASVSLDSSLLFNVWYSGYTMNFNTSEKKYWFTYRLPAASGNSVPWIASVDFFNSEAVIDLIDSTAFSGSFIEGESLGTGNDSTKDYTTQYPLIKSGAVVKVDGVEETGVTIDLNKPNTTNLAPFLKLVDWTNPIILPNGPTTGYTGPVAGDYLILENPFYEDYGIDTISIARNTTLEVSNNLSDWTAIASVNSSHRDAFAVSSTYRKYRYWRFNCTTTAQNTGNANNAISNDLSGNTANIHFDSAPAAGSAITIDYTTKVLAKNSNHVFDLTVEVQLGEYTPT